MLNPGTLFFLKRSLLSQDSMERKLLWGGRVLGDVVVRGCLWAQTGHSSMRKGAWVQRKFCRGRRLSSGDGWWPIAASSVSEASLVMTLIWEQGIFLGWESVRELFISPILYPSIHSFYPSIECLFVHVHVYMMWRREVSFGCHSSEPFHVDFWSSISPWNLKFAC